MPNRQQKIRKLLCQLKQAGTEFSKNMYSFEREPYTTSPLYLNRGLLTHAPRTILSDSKPYTARSDGRETTMTSHRTIRKSTHRLHCAKCNLISTSNLRSLRHHPKYKIHMSTLHFLHHIGASSTPRLSKKVIQEKISAQTENEFDVQRSMFCQRKHCFASRCVYTTDFKKR